MCVTQHYAIQPPATVLTLRLGTMKMSGYISSWPLGH